MRVLDAIQDRSAWLEVWDATGREPFAHPGYCRRIASPADQAIAVVTDHAWGRALVPLIRRKVPGSDMEDVCSPYGYGGPYFEGDGRTGEVLSAVRRYLERAGLVSGFLRLDLGCPDPGQTPEAEVLVQHAADNIVVDLGASVADRWRRVAHKVRKNVNKAIRAGCKVRSASDSQAINQFIDVYHATMRRRHAEPWFFFDRAFFEALLDELRTQARLFTVHDREGRVVSVELVLASRHRLYSYLGGTLSSAFAYSPNDLLKFEVIRYGVEAGLSEYVLGGGHVQGDGIFKYKASFEPDGIVPFRTARMIGSVEGFRKLTGCTSAGLGEQLAVGYFPSYRNPPVSTAEVAHDSESEG